MSNRKKRTIKITWIILFFVDMVNRMLEDEKTGLNFESSTIIIHSQILLTLDTNLAEIKPKDHINHNQNVLISKSIETNDI